MRCHVLAVVLSVVLTGSVGAAERPNIVWLISEDNSKHYLKLFDEHGAATPQIESLARQGLVFDHAFSHAPVCSVARTTLITSCYAPRIGTQFHRKSVTVPMPPGVRMFPAYLRQAGYYTTNNRKKDYNASEGKGVWDESSRKATWRNRRRGQPFFHQQTFTTTHESSLHFDAAKLTRQPTKTDPAGVHLAPYHPDTEIFRYTYARYHDRILQMDQQIGQVIAQLQQDGLLEETFVFYFADHGGVLPRSKGYAYESGLHVPLVVRIPEKWRHLVDAQPGTRVDGFVGFVDFGPTVLNLAGVKVPEGVDGRPFLGPGVSGEELNRRDRAYGYADRFDEKYDLVRTLRRGKFKYIRSYQPFNFDGLQNNYRYKMAAFGQWRRLHKAGKLTEVQTQFFQRRAPEALYDLEVDPHETKNLAGDPAYAEVLTPLRHDLADWVQGLPDLSFYPESYLAQQAFAQPVAFGRAHQTEIASLVEIADLSLAPFAEAKAALRSALDSENPWKRYWALITCSVHGDAAREFVPLAKRLAANDSQPLVRARAAEFLGLIQADQPQQAIIQALGLSKSALEVGLILNTVVLLKDGQPGYPFHITAKQFGQLPVRALKDRGSILGRRLQYFQQQTRDSGTTHR